jgi:hypothetical protein
MKITFSSDFAQNVVSQGILGAGHRLRDIEVVVVGYDPGNTKSFSLRLVFPGEGGSPKYEGERIIDFPDNDGEAQGICYVEGLIKNLAMDTWRKQAARLEKIVTKLRKKKAY